MSPVCAPWLPGADLEIVRRPRQVELLEEDLRHPLVVVLARVDHVVLEIDAFERRALPNARRSARA